MIAAITDQSATCPDWNRLDAGIRNNVSESVETFYNMFAPAVRAHVSRRVWEPEGVGDCVNQCLMLALEGIGDGRLREPARMPGYVWGVLRNVLRRWISARMAERAAQSDLRVEVLPNVIPYDPEFAAILSQQKRVVREKLADMQPLAREVLKRFYLDGAVAADIQRDLSITPTQFRLIKNRAKATLIETVRSGAVPLGPRPARKVRALAVSPKVISKLRKKIRGVVRKLPVDLHVLVPYAA